MSGGEIALEQYPGAGVASYGIGMENPDPSGTLPIGASIGIEAVGTYDGIPLQDLGACEVAFMGLGFPFATVNEYALLADFSPLGATEKRLEVRNGGALLYTGVTSLDTVGVATSFPGAYAYDLEAIAGGKAGWILRWPEPVTITVGGVDYTADALHVGLSGAGVANPSGVLEFAFTTRGIPEITTNSTVIGESVASSVDDPPGIERREPFRLAVWPSPSNGPVRLRLSAAKPGRLAMEIYDAAGRHVRTLANGNVAPGEQVMDWDARTGEGQRVSAGVYFVRGRLDAPGQPGQEVRGRFVIVR